MMRPIRTRLRPREARGSAVILMYHSISRGRPDPWGLCVDPNIFAKQLRLLKDRFRVVSFAALRGALACGQQLSRAVVITFDDGYRDNLLVAKPLLEQEGLPAVVFVTTGYVDSGRDFWWDELEAYCASAGVPSRPLWSTLKPLKQEDRVERLDRLWASIETPRPDSTLTMSQTELESLVGDELIELGAHTVTHPHLSSLSLNSQRDEIEASKADLVGVSGRPVEAFSYPHGDFSSRTVALVRSVGFRAACTTHSAAVPRKRAQPFVLPRVQVGNWDAEALEFELERLFA